MPNDAPNPSTPAQAPEPKTVDPVAANIAKPAAAGHLSRRIIFILVGLVVLALCLWIGVPWVTRALTTVSTDDAYVSDYVTYVAPRVSGQVMRVLVEDNNRVHKDDVLMELDPEPYQIQVNIAKAAVTSATADVNAALAAARANVGKARSLRFNLIHAIELVDNQVAALHASVATLDSQKASLVLAQADLDRAAKLLPTHAISQEGYDQQKAAFLVAQAQVNQYLEGVYQIRVSLGLPAEPPKGKELTYVPDDLDETFSSVRMAQGQLMEAAAQLGVEISSYDLTPKKMIAEFMKRDPKGDIDNIYNKIVSEAPAVKQAEAKLLQAKRNLDQANLNLRYCHVLADIDGVISRRNVNPGTNVQAGQQVMALQSVDTLWVDANFKETQLAELRIGQRVEFYADMYGSKPFKGHISGFTMGTGSTIALLPPENATGNFVKIVQRLPVRIELDKGYDPNKNPLFIGLSVTPYVYINEKPDPEIPHAGDFLQSYLKMTPSGQSLSVPPSEGAMPAEPHR